MNTYDEELQRKIEAREILEGNEDAKAYQKIFDALEKDPGFTLSDSFADRVIQKVMIRNGESPWVFFWFGFGFFLLVGGLVVATVASIAYYGFKPDLGFLRSIADYKGLLVVALILLTIFNYIDKRVVGRSRQST
jgi:hypothetical protein